MDPLPFGKVLMAANALVESAASKYVTPGTSTQGEARMLVLMSTCLCDASKAEVVSWVSKLDDRNQLYFDGSSGCAIEYVVEYMVGTSGTKECTAKASELIYSSSGANLPLNTTAAIFFAGDEATRDKMEMISKKDLSETFRFHFCEATPPSECSKAKGWTKYHTAETPSA